MNSDVWKQRLDRLTADHMDRHMRVIDSPSGPVISPEDGEKLNFCSNDYLSLANHPDIKRTMAEAALKWGAGSASSRLVSGNTRAHSPCVT